MRVRVIEPDDGQPACAGFPTRVDVIFGVNDKPVLVDGTVVCPSRFGDRIAISKQNPTAFRRRGLARVGNGGVERGPIEDHSASTTIAIPMPPPMHNDARP